MKWLGAVQAQDYYGAKWALGQRMEDATDEIIEKAFAKGDILRTLIAYKDRSAALDSKQTIPGNVVFSSAIVIEGRVVGSWKRTFKKNSVIITLSPFVPFKKPDKLAVFDAARRYATFLGLNAEFD